MNAKLCRNTQKTVNGAIRWLVTGSWSAQWLPLHTCYRELNIPPINAIATAARIRAITKAPSLRTHIGTLASNPMRYPRGKWTWVKRSLAGRTRVLGREAPKEPKDAHAAAKTAAWGKIEASARSSRIFKDYKKYKFCQSRKWQHLWEFLPNVDGFQFLLQARVGGLWTAKHAARAGHRHAKFLTKCPFCKEENNPETVAHIFRCKRWHNLRKSLLKRETRQLKTILGEHKSQWRAKDVSALLLGGVVRNKRIRNWGPSEGQPSQKWKSLSATRVATYLSRVMKERRSKFPDPRYR